MRPADILFPAAAALKQMGVCPFCGKAVNAGSFRNVISLQEFGISGLCQSCQDEVFGED
jgi:hypothetical protein